MMPTARALTERLADASAPPRGTGPWASGQRRWITARDVLAHYFTQRTPYRARLPAWDREPAPEAIDALGDNATLRSYQREAVASVAVAPDRFLSGEIEMGCGLGKTYVGGEIVRLTRMPAVIVTQHQISVGQWIAHLREVVGLSRVVTAQETWDFRAPLPDAVVTTYSAVVRTAGELATHGALLAAGGVARDAPIHNLLWALHCLPFGVLLLDEVHIGVADQFRSASQLNARFVVGLSGSMIREDDRLARMASLVGPRLFRYHASRTMRYEVLRTALMLPPEMSTFRRRGSLSQALHALNPAKICALEELLWEHRDGKVIIFCDSRRATEVLHGHIAGSLLLHGGIPTEHRVAIVEAFSCEDRARVLIATRVCDAAIDFPSGSVIVNLYSASGSRQQEVQRAGRGSRDGGVTGSHVVHLVNSDTEEERFVRHRMKHMATLCDVDVTFRDVDVAGVTADHHRPLAEVLGDAAEGEGVEISPAGVPQGRSRKRAGVHMP